jgi:hypothetical protein
MTGLPLGDIKPSGQYKPLPDPPVIQPVEVKPLEPVDTEVSIFKVIGLWIKESLISSILRQKGNSMEDSKQNWLDIITPILGKFIASKIFQVGAGIFVALGWSESSVSLWIAGAISTIIGIVISYFSAKKQLNTAPEGSVIVKK